MGTFIDAIVVEKESTVIDCLSYINQQHITASPSDLGSKGIGNKLGDGPSKAGLDTNFVFLPLDAIRPQPLRNNLRPLLQKLSFEEVGDDDIPTPLSSQQSASTSGAHLVIDLLTFDQQYEQAVRYAVGSTVVFPSLEGAMQVCFDFEHHPNGLGGERIRAVTLDGDLISKQGFITCGSSSIHRKAQVWGQKELSKAKHERANLIAERKEIVKSLRQEDDNAVAGEIIANGMDEYLISIRAEVEMLTERKKKEEAVLRDLNAKISTIQAQREKEKTQIARISAQLEKQRESIRAVEDESFREFCQQLHISSIRQFEKIQSEQNKQRDNVLRQIDREVNALNSKRALLIARSSEYILRRAQDEQKRAHDKVYTLFLIPITLLIFFYSFLKQINSSRSPSPINKQFSMMLPEKKRRRMLRMPNGVLPKKN